MTDSYRLTEDGEGNIEISSEEWTLIRDFCTHRDRLRHRLEYQPLDFEEEETEDLMYTNAVAFFDSSLRDVVANLDLDALVGGGMSQLDPTTKSQLKAMCAQLEKLVDTEQADIKAWKLHTRAQDQTAYPNLHALTQVLRNTSWPFELVAGQARGLFTLASKTIAVSANSTVSKFSSFVSSLSRASLADIPPTTVAPANSEETDAHSLHYPLQALRGLLKLVPQVKIVSSLDNNSTKQAQLEGPFLNQSLTHDNNSTKEDCHEHKVLLKLLSSPTIKPPAGSTHPALHLFVSTCNGIAKWQECRCDDDAAIIDTSWTDMENISLCDEINYAEKFHLRVCLACRNGKMFVLSSEYDKQTFNWRSSKCQPTRTLRGLLDGLNPATPDLKVGNTTWSLQQRRLLAAKLATSLLISLDCGHTLKSWDPEHVYFATAPDGQPDLQYPYVSCMIDDKHLKKTLQESDFKQPVGVFVSLARLLMEIEDGVSLREIPDSELSVKMEAGLDQPADAGYGALYYNQNIDQGTNSGVSRTPSLDRIDFRHALRKLLMFDSTYKRAAKSSMGNNSLETVKRLLRTEVVDMILSTVRTCSEIGITRSTSVRPQASAQTWSSEPLRSHHELPVRLFDDKLTNASDADDFFRELKAFHKSCSAEDGPERDPRSRLPFKEPSRPIRIAILDTGVNKSHKSIEAAFEMGYLSKDRCHSWVDENDKDVHDTHGHGTNATTLLLETAPEAEICIAKIFQGGDVKDSEVENIVKAIRHACQVWNADIISMSFGLQPLNSVNSALCKAYSHIEGEIEFHTDKIFFAAAGNSGDNMQRAFPASCEQVFGISASTGIGKDGKISPHAQGSEDNFMTLGISLPFINMKDEKRALEFRSGTSYATPIAAGIAAHILHVAESGLELEPQILECLRTRRGMREMFRLMTNGADDSGYRYLAPWVKLWVRNWHHDPIKIDLVSRTISNSPKLRYIPKKVQFDSPTRE